ncbi:hypothetical protein [uncultured Clostridium sp.]|nr:hypothetical protein [uncultured Clostridium sp.]
MRKAFENKLDNINSREGFLEVIIFLYLIFLLMGVAFIAVSLY